MQDKYKTAIVNLVQAQDGIRISTQTIGRHLNACWRDDPDAPLDDEHHQPHLTKAYRMLGPSGLDYDGRDVVEILTNDEKLKCPHCLAAHYEIQNRKKLRQSTGRARAWITRLGKELIKEAK